MSESFRESLEQCLGSIPTGSVGTCGAIARALGDVRAARAVWTWLREHPTTPFGHRAVRADGQPVLPAATRALRREGVRLHANRVSPKRFAEALDRVGLFDRLRETQRTLEMRVSLTDGFHGPAVIAGVDAAYRGEVAYVAAASVDPMARPIQVVQATVRAEFPYVPSYFAFRELPAIDAVVKRLDPRPDVLLVDGHGRLHPLRFGIACHAGVVLELPTIGVAKHRLGGRIRRAEPPATARPVTIEGRVEGFAWTPPGHSRSLYISPGHRVSLDSALAIIRKVTRRANPEPLRLADAMARKRKGTEKRETSSEV